MTSSDLSVPVGPSRVPIVGIGASAGGIRALQELFGALPAQPGAAFVVNLHDLGREKGKLCMSDHWHYGNGTGSTRKAAQANAISSWASFVDLEYGSDWARHSKAGSRKVSCSQGSEWNCQVEARPCK